jgi:hypothetical protein
MRFQIDPLVFEKLGQLALCVSGRQLLHYRFVEDPPRKLFLHVHGFVQINCVECLHMFVQLQCLVPAARFFNLQ